MSPARLRLNLLAAASLTAALVAGAANAQGVSGAAAIALDPATAANAASAKAGKASPRPKGEVTEARSAIQGYAISGPSAVDGILDRLDQFSMRDFDARGDANAIDNILAVIGGGGGRDELQADGSVKVAANAPPGFEGLGAQQVQTDFDVFFLGKRIGQARAKVENGQVTFDNPEALTEALAPNVMPDEVNLMLSMPLASNEQLRCLPGQIDDCGELPPGVSGVIVDPERFRITLFLGREYMRSDFAGPSALPDSISGPSLIENILLSASAETSDKANSLVSSNGALSDKVRYGATLETYASVGPNALVARTLVDQDAGARFEDLYVQRVRKDYRLAGGLLRLNDDVNLTNLRFVGAEFSTLSPAQIGRDRFSATPLDVLVARRARVEVYRDGVLVSAREYEPGLQLIDTQNLPSGSYPVRIVVRDGASVLSDETRVYTKAPDLPPGDKTYFTLRAGARAEDLVDTANNPTSNDLLPRTLDEVVLQATAVRRVGKVSALSVGLLDVANDLYPEVSYQTYMSGVRAVAGAAVGPDGQYSALVSANFLVRNANLFFSARSTRSDNPVTLTTAANRAYRPFFQDQDEVFGSVQTQIGRGSLTVRASYDWNHHAVPDQHIYGVRYSRPILDGPLGVGVFSLDAQSSDVEKRVGMRFTFYRRVSETTSLSYAGGAENISGSTDRARNGTSPIIDVNAVRRVTAGSTEVTQNLGASVDASERRIAAGLRAYSPVGSADMQLVAQQAAGQNDVIGSLLLNAETGFAIGGGAVKFGLRQPDQALILYNIEGAKAAAAGGDKGGYRLNVDGQAFDRVTPGAIGAVGLPPYALYSAQLSPDGAPAYDIDMTSKQVPLYPGNVVRLRWAAKQLVNIFGRVVGEDGRPIAGATIEAGDDVISADDQGYFTITAPVGEPLHLRQPGGAQCAPVSVDATKVNANGLVRLDSVTCKPPTLAAN